MENENRAPRKIIFDQNSNSQVEEILSDEDLGKLVSFFSILIEVDQRNKRNALRERIQADNASVLSRN